MDKNTREEVVDALQVVTSTINNCEKIQPKFADNTTHFNRFKNLIKAMSISKSLIIYEINKR